jgi:hypothetical protein
MTYLYPGQHLRMIDQPPYMLAVYLLHAIISVLIGPIYPITLTLFYYDQRIRHEGYDIERMMDDAGMNAPGASLAGDGTVVSVAEEVQP